MTYQHLWVIGVEIRSFLAWHKFHGARSGTTPVLDHGCAKEINDCRLDSYKRPHLNRQSALRHSPAMKYLQTRLPPVTPRPRPAPFPYRGAGGDVLLFGNPLPRRPLPTASRDTTVIRPPTLCILTCGAAGAGSALSISHAMARSKSYPFAASASSSSDGARVDPKTEESTSNGVIPSVSIPEASSDGSALRSCSLDGGESVKL